MDTRKYRQSETLSTGSAQLKRWVFARHSNPLSAWSRWASTPLIVLPIWKRSTWAGAAFTAWMLLNPIVFRSPRNENAWSTRAMLGEELWSERLRCDKASAINVLSTAAMVVSIVGARRRSAYQALPATAIQMTLTLVFWKLMADFYAKAQYAGQSTR